jgi:anti-sigma B factor antagonist
VPPATSTPPPVPPFVARLERDGPACVLVLEGELDLYTTEEASRVAAGAVVHLVDLAGLTFIDSTGLRMVLDLYRRAQDADQAFVVASMRPEVARSFEITGITQVVDVASDRRDALARLR